LSSNAFSDIGLYALCESLKTPESRLQSLKLNFNRLQDKACEYICDAFSSHRHLSQLQLTNNSIGDAGAGSLARLLLTNKSLSHLYLEGNQIQDRGAT